MVATYVLSAVVVLLGGLCLIHRNRVVAEMDALRDSARDASSLADRARYDVKRLEKLVANQGSERILDTVHAAQSASK